jgi:hypothetical protein
VLAHVPEDVRVDLAGAEDLDPRLAAADRAARAVAQEAVLAVEAGDVDLDARLGEREEVRAQADLALVAEDRAGEGQQRALQVGERDVLVDREPLDLVELRRVGRVGVAAVDPARDDDVQRWRVLLHRADLHRRGVRAQDDVAGDVERVRAQPRGVRRVVVERVEVVVDGLDLGPLHDVEAQAEEDVLDLAPHRGEQVQPADGLRRIAGQRHVDPVGGQARVELGGLQRPLASSTSASSALRASLAARPTVPRSSGGSWATPRSMFGSSALRPRNRTRSSSRAAVSARRRGPCSAAARSSR